MCTIGNVFVPEFKGQISFKQCDLKDGTEFYYPEIRQGTDGIRYLPFMREDSDGPWSGVNNKGVSFVAGDAYLDSSDKNKPKLKSVADEVFAAYTTIISDFSTAAEAADYMKEFYKGFKAPDIILICDSISSYFIETDGKDVICVKRTNNFFASANHFRMLYDGVPYSMNHSTYLRLQRAEAILQSDPNLRGVLSLLRDQYFGESVFSICRVRRNGVPPHEAPFYTQASVVFYTDGNVVNCLYLVNGNPVKNSFNCILDVFGSSTLIENIPDEEIYKMFVQSKPVMQE